MQRVTAIITLSVFNDIRAYQGEHGLWRMVIIAFLMALFYT